MRIGIIGGGVSGLVSAYLLSGLHEVELLEATPKLGGHTNTEDLDLEGGPYRINTGFIVFNEPNYPHFVSLLKTLNVPHQKAPMSFSVKCQRTGLEYGFATLNALFAQRRNLFAPRFMRMLLDIRRFRNEFETILQDASTDDQTLGQYLAAHGYSDMFVNQFLVPFGAAIWSADPGAMNAFPLRTFVAFFKHHGFLAEGELLQWHTVTGGSDRYISALTQNLEGCIITGFPVKTVVRSNQGIAVTSAKGETRHYDRVVIAVHSDQALAMLANPTPEERDVLGAIPYQPNDVVLHTDTLVMPEHRQTWSSWNYSVPDDPSKPCTATYDMNILQGIKSSHEFLVSLNLTDAIAPDKILRRFTYHHPVFTPESVAAQSRFDDINGVDRIHYAGAYWGFGFHEDGVTSALNACKSLGGTL